MQLFDGHIYIWGNQDKYHANTCLLDQVNAAIRRS